MSDTPSRDAYRLSISANEWVDITVIRDPFGGFHAVNTQGVWREGPLPPEKLSRRTQEVEAEWLRLGELLEEMRALEAK